MAKNIVGGLQDQKDQKISDLFMQQLFTMSPDLICVLSGDGIFQELNPAWEAVLGYSLNEMLGTNMVDYLHPEDIVATAYQAEALRTGQDIQNFINRYRSKDGSYKWLEWKGRITGDRQIMYAIARDITRAKADAELIKTSEMKYRALTEYSEDMIMRFDREYRHLYVNPAATRFLGFQPWEFIGKTHEELGFPKEDCEYWDSKMEQVFSSGLPFRQITPVNIKSGKMWFDWSLIPEFDSSGKLVSVLSYSRDVTGIIEAEQALKESEQKFRAVIDHTGEGIAILNDDEVFLLVNPAAEEIFGVTPNHLSGMSMKDFLGKDDLFRVKTEPENRSNGKSNSYELGIYLPDGSKKDLLVTATPLIDDERFYGTLGVFRDITDSKRYEAEILTKNEALRQANTEKDKFFSIIAHDLRGPFGSFMNMAKLLAEDLHEMSKTSIQKFMDHISKSASDLFELLENLLEWSRMQRGLVQINPQIIDLYQKIPEFIHVLRESANLKGIELQISIPEGLMIKGDSRMIESTIRNLASNAIKFTRKGGIVKITAKSGADSSVFIEVEDSGIGMSAATLEQLFRLDTKVSQPGTDGESSSGLGLILCKEYIQKHGGRIWVNSEVNHGSTFFVELPQGF